MKRIYWRQRKVSRTVLFAVALTALTGTVAVEVFRHEVPQPFYHDKVAAAKLADRCMETIRRERRQLGYEIDLETDPAATGLIGAQMTPFTSVTGHLNAKQLSTNPNFAAAVVDMLRTAGVEEGDCVAVGCSGSFPAINIAVCAALETLRAKPVIVASAAASQYGANLPKLLWIDMERVLHDEGLISFRSVACSLGGEEDLALGMPDESQRLLRRAITDNHLSLIEAETKIASANQRMEVYSRHADDAAIKAFINVGGGAVSSGGHLGKKHFQPGLNEEFPPEAVSVDSVMSRFAAKGVPVIHLIYIRELAGRYGLATDPRQRPQVAAGPLFVSRPHNRWLTAGVLLVVLLSMRMLVATNFELRLVKILLRRTDPEPVHPAQVVWEASGSEPLI